MGNFFLSLLSATLLSASVFLFFAILLFLHGGLGAFVGSLAGFALDAEQLRFRGFATRQRVRPVRLLAGDGVPLQASLLRRYKETRREERKRSGCVFYKNKNRDEHLKSKNF
jgi:hypothetical protein